MLDPLLGGGLSRFETRQPKLNLIWPSYLALQVDRNLIQFAGKGKGQLVGLGHRGTRVEADIHRFIQGDAVADALERLKVVNLSIPEASRFLLSSAWSLNALPLSNVIVFRCVFGI